MSVDAGVQACAFQGSRCLEHTFDICIGDLCIERNTHVKLIIHIRVWIQYFVCMYVCMFMYACVCVFVYIHVFVNLHVYVYKYMYKILAHKKMNPKTHVYIYIFICLRMTYLLHVHSNIQQHTYTCT